MAWAKDLPRDATFAPGVGLDCGAGLPDETAVLRDAIFVITRLNEFGSSLTHGGPPSILYSVPVDRGGAV